MADELYATLAEQFPTEAHKTLERAGGQTYVPWNLVAERLNTVLGVENWSFRVIREGFTPTECYVLGSLTATIRGVATVREQYGCTPLTTGTGDREKPVDDLLKKAGTDAFKKCAQVLGVGLYLTDAEDRAEVQQAMRDAKRPKAPAKPTPLREARPEPQGMDQARAAAMVTGAPGPPPSDDGPHCEECDARLTETRFKDGTAWSVEDLANQGRRKHNTTLCMTHYRQANAIAKRQAEDAAAF